MILSQEHQEFKYLYSINLHNFSSFNKENGWKSGDALLKGAVEFIQENYPTSVIFRVEGDDFVIMTQENSKITVEVLQNSNLIKESILKVSVKEYQLNETNSDSDKILEEILSSPIA